jgi:hypothetical protein
MASVLDVLYSLTEAELLAELRRLNRAQLLELWQFIGVADCKCRGDHESIACCHQHRHADAARIARARLLPLSVHAELLRLLWPKQYQGAPIVADPPAGPRRGRPSGGR